MDAVEAIGKPTKVCVYMETGISYASESFKFTKEKPFVLMEYVDAMRLIANGHGRFRAATKEEVAAFYNKNS